MSTGTEFVTRDPEEAHAFMRAAYVDNSMRIAGSPDGFRMRHTHRDAGPFSVARLSHTMAVEHRAQPLGYVLVGRILNGRMQRETQGETLRADRGDVFLIASPERPYTVRWESMDLQLTRIDSAALTRVVGDGAVQESLPAGGLLPVSRRLTRRVCDTLDFLTGSVLPAAGAGAAPLITDNATRLLAATLVTAFPALVAPRDGPACTDLTPAALRRATAFIESQAHTDIGLSDIAAAAHTTPRAVQYAFRRHLGTTPTGHLRRVRLDRAHRDLLNGSPDAGDTVAAISTRWGFFNQGRFAGAYRAVYGNTPRQTLEG
jgi:AraC-like DNA-binding protein